MEGSVNAVSNPDMKSSTYIKSFKSRPSPQTTKGFSLSSDLLTSAGMTLESLYVNLSYGP